MNSSGWSYDTPTSRPWKLDINNDDTVTINTYQDAQPIIDKNKQNLIDYGDKLTFGKASGRHTGAVTVASIPTNIWELWLKQTNGDIEKNPKLLAKYLNDPDNKFLRTTPTRI